MPDQFKLLVVTPTRGESVWMEQTVASVVKFGGVHVLVAPPAAVGGLAARFPGLSVVPEPAGGAGMYAAINAGIAAAADWHAFTYLNDDDLLLPDFQRLLGQANTTGARVVYGGVRLIDAAGHRVGAIPISPFPALNRLLYAQRIEPVFQHGTVITRAAFDQLGVFDADYRYCGDSEWLARACAAGVEFVCATRRPVAAFRLHAGQSTKNRPEMVVERARVDRKLGLLTLAPGRGAARWFARLVFRLANARIYAERVLRHGFVRFDTLLERTG